ncbi:MAG: hypothetical protein J6Z49_07955, partial [Kiritimatiellae bacterium]|nr:hypothetical protein [Kiritimatiellia bacterium]
MDIRFPTVQFFGVVLVSLALSPHVANGAFPVYRLTPQSHNLSRNVIYTMTNNITITATEPGKSALALASGAQVVLDIPTGITLTVVGGAARGTTGAGAGISLPAGAVLYVTGGGKLVATGGKAANGTGGSNGGSASYPVYGKDQDGDEDDDKFINGEGGAGGTGGGGAGAGIGGAGGTGARGADKNSAVEYRYDYSSRFDANGVGGADGAAGGFGISSG